MRNGPPSFCVFRPWRSIAVASLVAAQLFACSDSSGHHHHWHDAGEPRDRREEPGKDATPSSDPERSGADAGSEPASDAGADAKAPPSEGPVPEDYRTITLATDEQRHITVGGGETFENVLIDATASGADIHFTASGDDWAIRDVGVRGAFDIGNNTGGFANVISARGNGVIDNVYLGDGHDDGIRKGAIGVPAAHAGHIDVRDTYIARWTGNAVYAAGPARVRPPGKTDGGGGTIGFTGSYFRDNNIAHLRIASDGSFVRDSVIHNTNNVPPHPDTAGGGVVNSRGLYTGYGDPSQVVEVANCDIEVTEDNTNGAASALVSGTHDVWGELSTVRVIDSEVEGALIGHIETESVGDDPDTSIPPGVPTTAEDAARGL